MGFPAMVPLLTNSKQLCGHQLHCISTSFVSHLLLEVERTAIYLLHGSQEFHGYMYSTVKLCDY